MDPRSVVSTQASRAAWIAQALADLARQASGAGLPQLAQSIADVQWEATETARGAARLCHG